MADFSQPHALQHARLPCPSPTPRTCSSLCPSSRWCHATISSSVIPFSSSFQSFPSSGSFPMSLSFSISQSLLKLMSIASLMPSNHLILCHPLLLLPSIFPSIKVFSNESALHIRWPKYWSFSFSISPYSEYSGLISFRIDWFDLLASKGLSVVFSETTVQ